MLVTEATLREAETHTVSSTKKDPSFAWPGAETEANKDSQFRLTKERDRKLQTAAESYNAALKESTPHVLLV